jgi:outer membrane protein TolC
MWRYAVLLATASCAWAQFAGAGGAPPSRPVALPLTGASAPAGAVSARQAPATGAGVATISSSVDVSGQFQGSVPAPNTEAAPLRLSLAQAVQMGLAANLGAISANNSERAMRAARLQALSALLPNIAANAGDTVAQVNLAAYGFQFKVPPGLNFSIPTVVGPFNYSQLEGTLSQSIYDPVARRNWQASKETARAAAYSAQDARQLVVLAVSGTYMQTLAEEQSIASQQAQVANAEAVYRQAVVRKQAGMNARIDVMRSLVELDTQKQRLSSMLSELQKQKIALARLIGLPLGREIVLTDSLSFEAPETPDVQAAIQQAFQRRPDLCAAQAQVQAAERALAAARAERYPSASLNGDYGVLGPNPTSMHGVFTISAALNVPLWDGGRVRGDIQQAEATLAERRAELANRRGAVEQEVRDALVDLNTALGQVKLAQSNRAYARETFAEARDRFSAGVASTVEVVQAQEQVAAAESDYISSLFAFNLARLSLARATGESAAALPQPAKGGR